MRYDGCLARTGLRIIKGANPYRAPVVQGINGHLFDTTAWGGHSFRCHWLSRSLLS